MDFVSLDMLGAMTTDDVEMEAEAVGKKVSPWLWAFSLTGFALGVWSKLQINAMYGSHKNMRKALLK